MSVCDNNKLQKRSWHIPSFCVGEEIVLFFRENVRQAREVKKGTGAGEGNHKMDLLFAFQSKEQAMTLWSVWLFGCV